MTETRSLTYPELAEAIGRSEIAARSMVKRNRWRRMVGNDGRTRVLVPFEDLEKVRSKTASRPDPGPDTGSDQGSVRTPADPPDHGPDARALIAVLEARIGELQGRVAEMDTEVKEGRVAVARVAALEAMLDAERKRAEEIRETERQRVDEWKAVADRFATQAEKLAAAAEARRSWWPWRRSA